MPVLSKECGLDYGLIQSVGPSGCSQLLSTADRDTSCSDEEGPAPEGCDSNRRSARPRLVSFTVLNGFPLAVLEDFSLFLVLTNKSLLAYPLEALVPTTAHSREQPPRGHQKISDSKHEIMFFAVGQLNGRTLVITMRQKGVSATSGKQASMLILDVLPARLVCGLGGWIFPLCH